MRRRASVRTALAERDPLFGGGPAGSPQRAGISILKTRRAPRRAPFGFRQAPALALLVERRVDLRDLLGLERVAPGAVSVPVLTEAESEDAEVRAIAVGDLLQGGEQLLLGRRPRVGL